MEIPSKGNVTMTIFILLSVIVSLCILKEIDRLCSVSIAIAEYLLYYFPKIPIKGLITLNVWHMRTAKAQISLRIRAV